MNEILTPLAIITALGLSIVLIKVLNQLDKFNIDLSRQPAIFSRNVKQRAFLSKAKWYIYLLIIITGVGSVFYYFNQSSNKQKLKEREKIERVAKFDSTKVWEAPEIKKILDEPNYSTLQYGFDLISHTADYLGPEGIVKPISNGMNCQNCHLAGASTPFGNNYSAVAATYPKFRARSGSLETIVKRVNDCFQRSLNGKELDSTSREMTSIIAYIKWLGTNVPKGKTPKGSGLLKLPYLSRPANPDSGHIVFVSKCQSCHGTNGQGLPMPEGNGRRYPPLWGEHSFNEAAGLYRLSNLAGYVKANMPFGATYKSPQLTDAEAWDVASFVNTQPRPKHPFLKTDWPKIAGKPFDHPFGPYVDSFPESQHKFGPFQPIVDFQKKKQTEKVAKK